jgi:hypothetical protein
MARQAQNEAVALKRELEVAERKAKVRLPTSRS